MTFCIYYYLDTKYLLFWAILLSIIFAVQEAKNKIIIYENNCFKHRIIGPLMAFLAPDKIESTSKVNLDLKYTRKTKITGTEKSGKVKFRYWDLTGYVIFEDRSYKEVTKEKSLRDLETESDKKISFYAVVAIRGSSYDDTKHTSVHTCEK